MDEKLIFAAKCIFAHPQLTPRNDLQHVYEERIILVQAKDFEDAIDKAESDAQAYAQDGTIYLEYVDVFELFDSDLKDLAEVYSLLRSSDLPPDDYIDQFYDTGNEHNK